MLRHRNRILAVLAVGLVFVAGLGATTAAPPPPTPEYEVNEGPVFLIISFEPAFAFVHPGASETIMVNIGSFLGGEDVYDTRFVVDSALEGITLPDGRRDPKFDDLQESVGTVLGSFYALDEQGFHTVVPSGEEVVSVDLQQAIFEASNSGALDDLIAKKEFPTTLEIVKRIEDFLPPGSLVTEEDIDAHVFGSLLNFSVVDNSIEGDGELFPHEPGSASIFAFRFGLDSEGNYEQAISQQIPIKIQSPINLDDKNGVLPVTIESGRGFDASQICIGSLTLEGPDTVVPVDVDVTRTSLTGNNALVAKFSLDALRTAGLTTGTTTLTIRGTYSVDDAGCDDDADPANVFHWYGVDTVTIN